MEHYKVCLLAACLGVLLTAPTGAREISKTIQGRKATSWKESLLPHLPAPKGFSATRDKKGVSSHSLAVLPVNVAVMKGSDVTLICAATPGSGYIVQWWEFVYNEAGNIISEGNTILPIAPEAARYSIIQPTQDTFNLHISNVKWEDAGIYECIDVMAGPPPDVSQGGAELIVIESTPNCTTTLSSNGVVIEGQYHTAECAISYNGYIAPYQTWTGPPGFTDGKSQGPNTVWSGIAWSVNRSMDTYAYKCLNNFTDNFVPRYDWMSPVPPGWYFFYQTPQMFVYWGPTNMYVEPVKDFYEVGDILTCYADAFPLPTYTWFNTRTNEEFPTQGFLIDASLEGTTQIMRCQAQNRIQGFTYSDDIFLNVTVLAKTTTTTPASTTTPIPVGVCSDLSGRWEATEELRASLCLTINNTANGLTYGIFRNDSDTYWIEVVGRAQLGSYAQVGFTGIWPGTIGVSAFVGECHRCYGIEVLLVDSIQRSKGTECGVSGPLIYPPQYKFYRTGPACTGMEQWSSHF